MLSRMSKISVAASEDEPVVPQFEIGGLLLPQVEPIAYGRKPDMRARRRRCNCVKLWDVEAAGEAIRPIVGPQTAVIPQQNGVDAHARLDPDPRA